MSDFDAEFFLRRHCEDELQVEQGRLAPARARTLVVLGLLPLESAGAIVALYGRAEALRNDGGFYDDGDDTDQERPRTHVAPRVVVVDRTIDAPFGKVELRHVALAEDHVRIAVKVRFGKNGFPGGGRHHPGRMTLDVTDDRGTTVSLGFSGGGGNSTWRGHFTGHEGLSAQTQWIEIQGERIDLAERDHGATSTVHVADDTRDPGARASAYLEHCLELEQPHHWRPSALPAVLGTVLASGSLAADSPAVISTRAVWAAVSTGQVTDPQALPERWRSVLAPAARRPRAPKGRLAVCAVTPVFDGISVSVFVLSSRRPHFEVELEGHGSVADGFFSQEHDESPVSFTAVDDLGHHHVGHTDEWHTDDANFGGTVQYHPPLDPAATRLDLSFNTPHARAVVTVPLQWGPSA